MNDPLKRRITVTVLALLPLLLLIWASLRFVPVSAAELQAGKNPVFLSELARLPGSPDMDLPTAQLVPIGTDPRELNAAIPFFSGKIEPAPAYRAGDAIVCHQSLELLTGILAALI